MRDELSIDIFNKYLEIKQDLINNLDTVFNRQDTYGKKYRGNRFTDIHVGFDITGNNRKIIQIFIRKDKKYIKDIITFNRAGLIDSDIKTNLEIYG